ncbi:DUF5985 family protein [Ramlibacter sp.]|uniref:DUF5985 family protein n=1 Tax=Ramlibacter sp. TaxID=1917967 RepID=UPI002C2B7F5A|nr:DUF5985 family protein [Ramlibacter sp.]HWI81283.1 DUF5985 family protein [Ramlibacter sp.]
MNQMLSGAIAVSSLLAGLFFLRFWRNTGDRFFLYFALSFALEGLNRVALGLLAHVSEDNPLFYSVRVMAYGLIVLAIWQKNRRRP